MKPPNYNQHLPTHISKNQVNAATFGNKWTLKILQHSLNRWSMPATPNLHRMNVSHYYRNVYLWFRFFMFHKFVETNRWRRRVYRMNVTSLHVTNQITVLPFGVLIFKKPVQLHSQTFKGPHADATLLLAYYLQFNVYGTRGWMSLVEPFT